TTIYPLWADAPSSRDLLGYADIGAAVVDAIRREGLDPVALGVFGSWGSGKSTILELVAIELPMKCSRRSSAQCSTFSTPFPPGPRCAPPWPGWGTAAVGV